MNLEGMTSLRCQYWLVWTLVPLTRRPIVTVHRHDTIKKLLECEGEAEQSSGPQRLRRTRVEGYEEWLHYYRLPICQVGTFLHGESILGPMVSPVGKWTSSSSVIEKCFPLRSCLTEITGIWPLWIILRQRSRTEPIITGTQMSDCIFSCSSLWTEILARGSTNLLSWTGSLF